MVARRDFPGSSYLVTVCVRQSFACWDPEKMSSGKSVGESTRWGSVLSEWKLGPKLGWRLGVLLASVVLSSPGVNGDAGHLWSSLTEKGPQLMKLAQVSKRKTAHTGARRTLIS